MNSDFFITKRTITKCMAISCILIQLQSCHNKNETEKAESSTNDTINYTNNNKVNNIGTLEKLNTTDDIVAERRQMIMMQIDSTYAVINLLDDAKQELTDISSAEMTVAERNKKSKAIFNINIIQNQLIRELDAAILNNVRERTKVLSAITAEIEENTNHLKRVTQKLNKATQSISRLTNILALGLSKGFIKPPTPKETDAATIKETVQ